jgi:hypothetical protein
MRDIVGRLGLKQAIFENITDALKILFELDPSKQRLDPLNIFSNMAYLGRVRLFVKTIRKFLFNLKRHHTDQYQSLGEITRRYDERNDGQFAVKPSESSSTLQVTFTMMQRSFLIACYGYIYVESTRRFPGLAVSCVFAAVRYTTSRGVPWHGAPCTFPAPPRRTVPD